MTSGSIREQQDLAAFRTRRFRLALLTGFAGKGVSVLLQIVALPLAIAALGAEKFGVYAMLAAVLSWIGLASVTVAPGLTIQLVDANARGDRQTERKVFSSALFFAVAVAVFLFISMQIVLHVVGIEAMFGVQVLKFHSELVEGLWALCLLMAANIVMGVAEAAQGGYQNHYLHNIFISLGNVVTIIGLALLVRVEPTIANMILAVYGPPVAARLLSMLQLFYLRTYLWPRLSFVDLPILRTILVTGAAFSLTTFAAFGYQSFSVYWVGRQVGPAGAALMALCVMILNVSGSVLLMLTQPLWPAIRDAVARNDLPWVRLAYRRMSKHVMIYVGLAALVIAFAGGHLARRWIKIGMDIDAHSQWFLGLYFLLVAWEHINHSFLIGMGRHWFGAFAYAAGALIMLLMAVWLVGTMGISGMLLAMCAGPFLTTVWLYPLQIAKLFAAGEAPKNHT